MSERINLVTPVGRIVAGDLWEPRTKDFQGNPLKVKTGPNAGQDRAEYYIGLAIPKNSPEWPAIHAAIYNEARRGFPNLFDTAGNFQGQKFAWKFVDGDDTRLNLNNVRPCDKEGYPGHYVLSLASSIAPKVYDRNNQPIDPMSKTVKRGDYVRVQLSFISNDQPTNPGLYMSANLVQFSHQGEEISSGPDAAAVFGAVPMPAAPVSAATTPGPSLQPMLTGTVGNPNASTAAAPGISTPNPVSDPAPVAPANVAPAHDFLNPPTPTAPVSPAPVVEQFLVNGAVYTRDVLRAHGWTDVQIDAQQRA